MKYVSNLFNILFFRHLSVLLNKNAIINYSDFIPLPINDRSLKDETTFTNNILSINHITKSVILKKIILNNVFSFMKFSFLIILATIIAMLIPILLINLLHQIEYLTSITQSIILAVSGLVTALIFRGILISQSNVFAQRFFILSKRNLVQIIIKKILIIGNVELDDNKSGLIQNLVNSDTDNIANLTKNILTLAITTIQIILLSIMLYWQLGLIAFVGILIMLLSLIIIALLMRYLNIELQKSKKYKDKRISYISELIKKFRQIRMTGLVEQFKNRIHEVRENEITSVFRCNLIYMFMQIILLATPLIISIITFSLYIFVSETISATKVFSVIALFSLIRSPMMMMSGLFYEIGLGNIALNRLTNFLNLTEKHADLEDKNLSPGTVLIKNVVVKHGNKCVLDSINLNIKPGELIAITGDTGVGKTALLNLIAGYDDSFKGSIKRYGRISHLQHYMWLANDTLKNNILFGRKYEESFYNEVLAICQLKYDITILPAGDQTLIGELGTCLSGGQQQRVALARVLYSNSDILLLDNPMSALDPVVAYKFFSNAILNSKNKTRILVINDPLLIQQCDRAFKLKDGKLESININAYRKNSNVVNDSNKNIISNIDTTTKEYNDELTPSGNIKWSLIKEVFKQSGKAIFLYLIVILIGLAEALRLTSELFLATQSNQISDLYESFMYSYVLIGLSAVVFIIISQFLLYTRIQNHTRESHKTLLNRIVNSPMLFFDSTPQGRIINRFDTDIDVCSGHLLANLNTTITIAMALLMLVIFISIQLPIFIVVILIIGVMYWHLQKNYRIAARSVRRTHSILRSPLFTTISETIRGAATFRLNKNESYANKQVVFHLERNFRAIYTSTLLQSWLNLRQNLLSIMITVIIVGLVIATGGGVLGTLAVTYAVLATNSIAALIGNLAQVEWDLNSAWRIGEYCLLKQETGTKTFSNLTTNNMDRINFKNVKLKYSNNNNEVLKGLTFTVKQGEKVGICGRTGAGKSSIFNALLSMYPITDGEIILNGVNIADNHPEISRKHMTILTQVPLIFSGSIYDNIDPSNTHDETTIYNILTKIGLSNRINLFANGINTKINDAQLSAGETQLLVITRALLENNSIILLDEATSDMDHNLMEKTIKILFNEKPFTSFLLISHSLSPLMHMDKVLLMDDGIIIEQGPPHALYENTKSHFFNLFKNHSFHNSEI